MSKSSMTIPAICSLAHNLDYNACCARAVVNNRSCAIPTSRGAIAPTGRVTAQKNSNFNMLCVERALRRPGRPGIEGPPARNVRACWPGPEMPNKESCHGPKGIPYPANE